MPSIQAGRLASVRLNIINTASLSQEAENQDAIHVIIRLKCNGVIVVIGLCAKHVMHEIHTVDLP